MAAEKLRRAQQGLQVIDFCYPKWSTARKNPETKQTKLQIQTLTESARRAGRASGRPQREAKSRRRRYAKTKTAPPDPQRQRAGHGPATEKRKQSHPRRRGKKAGNRPTTRNDPEGHEPRRTPRGPNRRTGWPQGSQQQRSARGRETITQQRGAALPRAAGTRGPAG